MQFTKRVGRTVYHVQVHASGKESGSSFEDTLARLVVNDPLAFYPESDILKASSMSRWQPERKVT